MGKPPPVEPTTKAKTTGEHILAECFLHYHKKLARWWRQERLREWHDFEEAIAEHLNLMASRPDLLKSNVGGKPSSKVRPRAILPLGLH